MKQLRRKTNNEDKARKTEAETGSHGPAEKKEERQKVKEALC
jgi:hypothetical protein